LDHLAGGWSVIAWDGPGCGRSDDPRPGAGLADHARILGGFVDELGLDQPHVLGQSWGAVLALEVQRQRPMLARSLVLAAAYAGWTGSLPPDVVTARLEAAVAGVLTMDASAVAAAWLPTLLSASAPAETVRRLGSIVADFHRDASIDMLRALAAADLRPVLPTIIAPTLIIHGRQDTRSPLAVATAMRQAIPGARLEILDDVGHVLHMEAPDRFDTTVARFLASVEAPRTTLLD